MSIEINEKITIFKRFLAVAYGLSEAEIDAFLKILESKGGKDVDTISAELGISKSRTSLVLKKLADAGLIEKEKGGNSRGGRPKYIYNVRREELKEKLAKKAEDLCRELKAVISISLT
ncbi:helix-turn-helix domain-containing protein [Stygiolobus caldivivus]|uniref:Transcriptional regulator n=1 Tax=Stygiolobus caldivivus TaxID=2824673 RepID=A0A8D5U8K7_9CREN|nr:helix-turn-helix domain-containing protein [Stygiolobus caldivivus]BCU70761.1 transcriptional regulator [Stygiolobus caldivivus]